MLQEPPTAVRHQPRKRRGVRRFRDEFRSAVRGIKRGARGHSRFAVHGFVAAAAVAACVALDCHAWEWGLVLLCVGAVFTAELFHSALVAFFHDLDPGVRPVSNRPLTIAAGGVLTISLTAGLVGAVVFVRRFGELMGLVKPWGRVSDPSPRSADHFLHIHNIHLPRRLVPRVDAHLRPVAVPPGV